MSCYIHGLSYTREEALSYAKELAKAKAGINLKQIKNMSCGEICSTVRKLEADTMTKMVNQMGLGRKELGNLLAEYVGEYDKQYGGAEYLQKCSSMNKKQLAGEVAEAEIYSQIKKCQEDHRSFSKGKLLKMAKAFHLPGKLESKSKAELVDLITKRHMEALTIVNYFR